MTQNETYLVFGVSGFISFAMLIIGLISFYRVRKFLSNAVETKGIVTESVYKGEDSDGGGSMYSPNIRFTDRTGREYNFTENWSSNVPDFNIGDEVIVFYDPDKPEKARRGGKQWKFYFVAWLVGGLGLFFCGMLVFMAVIFLIL